MRNSLINISTCLLYLLPLAIVTGPFLPDLFICIIGISFLIISIRDRLSKYYKNYFCYFFTIFYIYLLIASLHSDYIFHSIESVFFYFRFGIFSLAVWFLIDTNKNLIKNFTKIFLILFLISIIDGYYQFFLDQSIFGFSSPGTRLNLILNDDRILGGYLSRLFPFLLGLLIFTYHKASFKTLIFAMILIISIDLLIYLSGERTALGLLILSIFLLMMLLSKYKKIRIITLIISIFIIVIVSYNYDHVRERNIEHTISQISGGTTGTVGNKLLLFSATHHSLYITSWRIFLDNPLTGSGPNTFRLICNNQKYAFDNKSCSTHPHNTYLQIISEIGIIGLLFILLIFSYITVQIFKHIMSRKNYSSSIIRLSDYQICLIISFILTLFPLLPTQNFFNNWINVIYFFPVGFYLHSINISKSK